MGLPDSEVGQLNLLEFDLLLQRKQANDNRARLNAGFIASAILNSAWGDPNRKAVSPFDYLPENARPVQSELDLTKMTPEAQRDYLMNLFSKREMRKGA